MKRMTRFKRDLTGTATRIRSESAPYTPPDLPGLHVGAEMIQPGAEHRTALHTDQDVACTHR